MGIFKRPKRIEFYKRIPQETIPNTFNSIRRNKRRDQRRNQPTVNLQCEFVKS